MDSIVLDTNVVVSALISKNSPPARIIDELVLTKRVELILSDEIMAEYIEVINRPKFARFADFKTRAELLLTHLHQISTKFAPGIRLAIISDEPDNRFLELSIFAQADFLVTGNSNDFTMKNIGQTKVVSPREFFDLYFHG